MGYGNRLYCSHWYTYGGRNYCDVDNKPIDDFDKCSYNYGSGCRKKYYIATVTNKIVCNGKSDSVLDGIRTLRDEYLEKDEKYSDLLDMYDFIGPEVASRMDEDENRVETATKVYSILSRIAKLVQKEEIAKATRYYTQMVGALINKYNLGEFYEDTNEKVELADKKVKKYKIGQKTLD